MKIQFLLTGATGNLGLNVINELLRLDCEIKVLVLSNDPMSKYLPKNIKVLYGNVLDKKSLNEFFNDSENFITYVIHMAAIVTTTNEYNDFAYNVNVDGTKNIIDYSLYKKVKKLIYISSSSAITELPIGETITENCLFEPEKIIGFYGKTKAIASKMIYEASVNNELQSCIIFPTALIGPGDRTKGYLTNMIIDVYNNKFPVSIAGGFDIVDVRDVAKGIVQCALNTNSGEAYLLSGNYLTVSELINKVLIISGKMAKKVVLPINVVKLFIPFSKIYCKLFNKKELLTEYALYNLYRNNTYSNEKAKLELLFSPRSVNESIHDTIDWLKDELYI